MKQTHFMINTILIVILYIFIITDYFKVKIAVSSINFFSDGSIIENLYYVAGVLSIVAILIAVVSYKTTKEFEQDKRKREIVVQTINLCNSYIEGLLPRIDSISGRICELKFTGDFLEISPNIRTEAEKIISGINNEDYAEYMLLLNKLEGFSFYFQKGYYSKEIAKEILSNIFCEDVNKFGYLIINERISNTTAFDDLISFYKFLQD
jgi:hypothetical protein